MAAVEAHCDFHAQPVGANAFHAVPCDESGGAVKVKNLPIAFDQDDEEHAARNSGGPRRLAVGVPLYPDCKNDALAVKFMTHGYKDTWAAVAFGLVVVAPVVGAWLHRYTFPTDGTEASDTAGATTATVHGEPDPQTTTVSWCYCGGPTVVAAIPLSIALVQATLALMWRCPRGCIIASRLLVAAAMAVAALHAHVQLHADLLPVAVLAALALFHVVRLYIFRDRIPLASVLLSHSARVVTMHPGVVATSFLCAGIFLAYGMLHARMMVPIAHSIAGQHHAAALQHHQQHQQSLVGCVNSGCEGRGLAVDKSDLIDIEGWRLDGITTWQCCLLSCCLFMLFWAAQVCANVSHVTSSGTAATWYFAGNGAMPHNPSVASFRRAVTTSFGSICFGALVVAVLQLLHAVVQGIARKQRSLVGCVALCFVAILELLMRYFNMYALTHVAMYGSGFLESAQRTWALVQRSGVTAIVNDHLAFTPLAIVTLVNALFVGLLFHAVSGSFATALSAVLLSYLVNAIALRSVYSGIVTLFVCFAENPEYAEASNPAFHRAMVDGTEAARQSVC